MVLDEFSLESVKGLWGCVSILDHFSLNIRAMLLYFLEAAISLFYKKKKKKKSFVTCFVHDAHKMFGSIFYAHKSFSVHDIAEKSRTNF